MKKIRSKIILRMFSLGMFFSFTPFCAASERTSPNSGIILDFCIPLSKITTSQAMQAVFLQMAFDHASELKAEERILLIDCIKEIYFPFIYKLPIVNEDEKRLQAIAIQELYSQLFFLNLLVTYMSAEGQIKWDNDHLETLRRNMRPDLNELIGGKYKEQENVHNPLYLTKSYAIIYEKHYITNNNHLSEEEKNTLREKLHKALAITIADQKEVSKIVTQEKIIQEKFEHNVQSKKLE